MRLAHLSDVHLVAPVESATYRLRASAIRFGRSRDASVRAAKLARALRRAREAAASTVIVSGDLTELGDDAELEVLGSVLEAAGADDVVLVPGNHDAYSSRDAWHRALRGPLARWAETSAPQAGVRVVDRGEVVVVAVDTSRPQAMAFSGGELTRAAAGEIDHAIARAGRTPCVIVAHHPPFLRRETTAHRVLDALRGRDLLLDLLARHENAVLLHGHFHRRAARVVPTDERRWAVPTPRIFGASAVADDGEAARVATYDVDGRGFVVTDP